MNKATAVLLLGLLSMASAATYWVQTDTNFQTTGDGTNKPLVDLTDPIEIDPVTAVVGDIYTLRISGDASTDNGYSRVYGATLDGEVLAELAPILVYGTAPSTLQFNYELYIRVTAVSAGVGETRFMASGRVLYGDSSAQGSSYQFAKSELILTGSGSFALIPFYNTENQISFTVYDAYVTLS